MNRKWSLDVLYTSFDAPEFKRDMERLDQEIGKIQKWTEENLVDTHKAAEKLEQYIQMMNEFYHLYTRLADFAHLTLSTEAKNEVALKYEDILDQKATSLTKPEVTFIKWLGKLEELESYIDSNQYLKEHEFFVKEKANENKYLLSDEEEVLISKMKNTGSNAWTKLQEMLSSTLLVDITVDGEEKKLPLPVVRNMAYSDNAQVRKTAYEAELENYKKLETSSAACLNGIKGEVITLAKMRGYASPLEMTVLNARMDMQTLDAMLTAIRESLPAFHKYFRKKGELLGYNSGLPFFEMFAPMGDVEMKFTYKEARDYIVKNFRTYSDKLADFAATAFDEGWIDAEPREGKRGGAFCANLHVVKQSRILSNFDGSFSNMTTLAHELGHGYHGANLMDETYVNAEYPMPIAETASIFCETIVKEAALKNANKEEAFTILESDISDAGQVIVDIYSRFLFESELFRRREEGAVSVNELKEIMLDAQKQAYGDGLDHNFLHPYMWACKPHYYYASHNFYNFPYAFGLLFAKGLYAEYLKRGDEFVDAYDRLLSVTGKNKIAEVTMEMGIDVRNVDFWRSSLKLIERDIEKFINLK
ncbi:MAG: oligoendopeptidase F [Clostridiales bacterium GWB2_37_7]|nr:MAG: oligoendopeptidase F [Clostridiales bacterium GWB2_37_7]